MVVTLDQLRPYDHDPRMKRNPAYEEIKASIRERGLDAAPAITRRPGEDHYIIRNGGNTRLAILRELWSETKEERFFRISCLFRPWPERGEIVALTGHLAENELRRPHVHRARARRRESTGVLRAGELRRPEPVGTGPPPWRDGFPSSGRTSPAWPTRCFTCCPPFPLCSMAAWGAAGRRLSGHAHGTTEAPGSTTPRTVRCRAGLRQFLSGGAGAVRHTGATKFAPQRIEDELIGECPSAAGQS